MVKKKKSPRIGWGWVRMGSERDVRSSNFEVRIKVFGEVRLSWMKLGDVLMVSNFSQVHQGHTMGELRLSMGWLS